jgi:iron complex outermembrane receptor protein
LEAYLPTKAATRYKFADFLTVRGSINTGFRAPDLAQFYYTETSTTFQNGVAIDQVTANNENPATKALGIPSLTPERSKGYTAGITSSPIPNFELTVDAYKIDIRDRVGNTGRFSATDTNLPADVRALFVANRYGAGQVLLQLVQYQYQRCRAYW